MIKKNFYDFIAILGLIALIIKIILIINAIIKFSPTIGLDWILSSFNSSSLIGNISIVITSLILFISWIFLLILALQLFQEKQIKLYQTLLIAIFCPIVGIFYFAILRGALKKYHEKNPGKKRRLFQNAPGTP